MRTSGHTADKNSVELLDDRVIKYFVIGHHRQRRFDRELEALRRLAGVQGVPAVLDVRESERCLVIERLPGQSFADTDAEQVPESFYLQLRDLVETLLAKGVARHVMPARDIIVKPDFSPGLVDYERATLKTWWRMPIWSPACEVSRFHLLNFLSHHAPQLLTEADKAKLAKRMRLHYKFRQFIEWRRRIKKRFRKG